MLSPITRFLHPHTRVTFRCRDHDNLAREIDKHEIHVSNLQRLPKKSNKSILVQYSTVRYCTVLSKCPLRLIRFIPLTPSPPHPSSLSPVVVTAEDFRRRSKLSDNMAISDSVTCRCAELFCSNAHLLESKVTQHRGRSQHHSSGEDSDQKVTAWKSYIPACEADEI